MTKSSIQKILIVLSAVIAISLVGIFILIKNNGSKPAPTGKAIISITPKTYNFGKVSQSKGITSTVFEVKNKGASDLIIDKIETSCNCTSASIIYQEREGPKFAMPGHGINEAIGNWQVAISPGDGAELKVYYDPNVHKNFQGPAVREIRVFSNDPTNPKAKVRIELVQVD